jgi:hypothetical protein
MRTTKRLNHGQGSSVPLDDGVRGDVRLLSGLLEIEEMLLERGWELGDSSLESGQVLLVTCVANEKMERAMLRRLRELASVGLLVAAGCMATALRGGARRRSSQGPPSYLRGTWPGPLILWQSWGPEAEPLRPPRIRHHPIASGCIGSCWTSRSA